MGLNWLKLYSAVEDITSESGEHRKLGFLQMYPQGDNNSLKANTLSNSKEAGT